MGVSLLICGLAWAQTPSGPSCRVQPSQAAHARSEGVTELTADIGVICTGGQTVPAGARVPAYTITVTLNTPLTSRVVNYDLSEALLIVDEAYPGQPNPTSGVRWPGSGSPQNLCRATGPNACPMIGTGLASGAPGGDYDGTAGHYNVFEGVASAFNSVSFLGVSIDAPGSFPLYLRITNLRANASQLLLPPFTSAEIAAFVTGLPGSSGDSVTVGLTERSLLLTQTPPVPVSGASNTTLSFTFSEGVNFPSAFKTATDFKNAGPQNVPGFAYNSESGLWDKVGPPAGISFLGLANHGTRLMLHFSGYPPGVNIVAPAAAYLVAPVGQGTRATGAAMYVAADSNGNSQGGPTPASSKSVTVSTDSQGAAWLTYEVVGSAPAVVESLTIPITIESLATGVVTGSYGPLLSSGAAPIPRFVLQ